MFINGLVGVLFYVLIFISYFIQESYWIRWRVKKAKNNNYHSSPSAAPETVTRSDWFFIFYIKLKKNTYIDSTRLTFHKNEINSFRCHLSKTLKNTSLPVNDISYEVREHDMAVMSRLKTDHPELLTTGEAGWIVKFKQEHRFSLKEQ